MKSYVKNKSRYDGVKLKKSTKLLLWNFFFKLKKISYYSEFFLISSLFRVDTTFSANLKYNRSFFLVNINVYRILDRYNITYLTLKNHKKKLEFFYFSFIVNLMIMKIVFTINEKTNSVISLPKKKMVHTVLRSPHTDKRSREQFKRIDYHYLITYPSFIFFNPYYFYNIIDNSITQLTIQYLIKQ